MKKIKISELPLYSSLKGLYTLGTDSANRSVKVSMEFVEDTATEVTKAAIASMLPDAEYLCSYGIERDITISSPTCTRVGNAELHKTLPIQSKMRGCLLDDDGNVVEYLDSKSWTAATRDGSKGQVMVEIPKHYRKFSYDGNIMSVRISELPLEGYHIVPKMYVSAYEAAFDRTNNMLASVVNDTARYRGGSNQSEYDGTYRSFLGRPISGYNRTDFRTLARNRKSGSTEWNIMTYDAQKTLFWLFVIEYATLNTQAAYNSKLTDEGYHQGGLGAGVTKMTDWSSYNSKYPFIPCGASDSLGNRSGQIYHKVVASDGTSTHYSAPVPRYRGVENPFGHLWKWVDGIDIQIIGGSEGLSKIYVCSDPAKFQDSISDDYTYVGDEARSDGYVKNIVGGEYGEIMPKELGGGSTTYYCDYHMTHIPSVGEEKTRAVMYGGNADAGDFCGLTLAITFYEANTALQFTGTRLCFIPTT